MNVEKIIETITLVISTYSIKIAAALAVYIVGKWISLKISNILGKVLEKKQVDPTLLNFLKNMSYYTLLLMVVIAAVGQLGVNTTSFLTIVGAAALAIGLALKDSLSNFASGVMLVLFRPFHEGDVVTAAGTTGKVTSLAIFSTTLTTPDNQQVIVPNSAITANIITNITANATRRIDMVIGIGYNDNIGKAKTIMMRLIEADPRILKDPAPTIALAELADSSVNFNVRPWVKTEDYWAVRSDLTEKIKMTFDEEGISIPYPQQDLHLFSEQTQKLTSV